jgi:type I restriction enzyme S subunit
MNKKVPKLRFKEFEKDGEWEEKRLGDIVLIIMGQSPSSKSYNSNGNGIYLIQGNADIKNRKTYPRIWTTESKKECKIGDIILTVRAPVGYVAKSIHNACIGRGVCALRSKKNYFLNFVYYFLLYFEKEWKKLGQGSTFTAIGTNDIKNLKIRIPVTQKEQQKIADTFSSLDNLIMSEDKKLQALQTYKKGLMQQLFPKEGERVPKLRFKEFKSNGEWEENTLINIANFRRGSFPQPYGLDKWYDDKNGIPFIQVYDVDENFKLKPTTKRKISKLGAKQSIYIPSNTLIITIQGSIGRVAITQYHAYIDRTLLLFQEFKKPINKIFFAYILKNLFEIEKNKAPGGIIKTITKEVLSNFIVKIPKTPKEQQKIANTLSSLDNLIENQSKKIEKLKEHKKGLMQQMFVSDEER